MQFNTPGKLHPQARVHARYRRQTGAQTNGIAMTIAEHDV